MRVTTIGSLEITMQNPDSIHNYFAWSTVTRLQNGKIAVVASCFRKEHVCPFEKTVISCSEGDGKSWDAVHDIYVNGISSDLGYPATVEMSYGSLLTVLSAIPEKGKPAITMQQRWSFEKLTPI